MKEYWFCIIGPIERETLPDGADFPMRAWAKEGFKRLTGNSAEDCYSGWGVTEEMLRKLLDTRHEMESPK